MAGGHRHAAAVQRDHAGQGGAGGICGGIGETLRGLGEAEGSLLIGSAPACLASPHTGCMHVLIFMRDRGCTCGKFNEPPPCVCLQGYWGTNLELLVMQKPPEEVQWSAVSGKRRERKPTSSPLTLITWTDHLARSYAACTAKRLGIERVCYTCPSPTGFLASICPSLHLSALDTCLSTPRPSTPARRSPAPTHPDPIRAWASRATAWTWSCC